jgi:hypothetical protein
MKNLFILVRSHWEDWVPYYFEGPENVTQREFRELCTSLLEQAGYNSVVQATKSEYSDHVGWNEVVESMIPLLEKQGYRHFKPKQCVFSGPGVIDSITEADGLGGAANMIIAHNKRLSSKY